MSGQLLVWFVVAVVVLAMCAVAFWVREGAANNPDVAGRGVGVGFVWVTRTLLEGASPFVITTGIGTFLNYVVLVAGVALVATGTGAVASKLVELVLKKGSGMGNAKLKHHVVICGWNAKGHEILRELHADEVADKRPVVVLANLETTPTRDTLVTFVRGNPSDDGDLRRAAIQDADTAIVLADDSNPSAHPDDIDAKTLLTTLAVETIVPDVYTCVEVLRSENRRHFERTKANELVVSAEVTGALLASSAANHGISRIVSDLITHPQGHEFYWVPLPPRLHGATVRDAMIDLKERHDCTLVALETSRGYEINPPADRRIEREDRVLVISRGDPAPAVAAGE